MAAVQPYGIKIEICRHASLNVLIDSKIIEDYKNCYELATTRDCNGGDCQSCSLNMGHNIGIGLCEIKKVEEELKKYITTKEQ